MPEPPGEVTLLLAELKQGNSEVLNKLIPLVYTELRRLAAYCLRMERSGHTLQPTALVHEAYLRLVGQDQADWQNHGQFLHVASRMMRRILVDYARARLTGKRAGDTDRWDLGRLELPTSAPQVEQILAVDEAVDRLAEFDPQQARVVELRYFAGLTVEETAEALGVSARTVKRDWAMASAWLYRQLAATHV